MKTCGMCNHKKQCREFGIYGTMSNHAEKCKKFEERLKPCPFCGTIPEYRKDFPTGKLHTVSCENEKCKIHPYALGESKNKTIEKWNYRAD